MPSNIHTLEPFPRFVDSSKRAPNYFSSMTVLDLLSSSSVSQLRQSHDTALNKLVNYIHLRYYQYEVTWGLYMLTFNEKVLLNTIVLSIFAAFSFAIYSGLQPFVVRSLCQLIYFMTGSLTGIEELCTDAACS